MTSEQKAQSWDWAAKLITDEAIALSDRGELDHDIFVHRLSIATSLRSQAARIRRSSKARRERGE